MTMALMTGLALGLASSAHCAAMCGPLVLTIAHRLAPPSRAAQLRYAVIYHSTRIAAYAIVAVAIGFAGEVLVLRGLGRVLAVAAGVLLLSVAAASLPLRLFPRAGEAYSRIVARASLPLLRWARPRPIAGAAAAGMLNGLLPCGLVYAALAAACATGRVSTAVLLMTGFGLGTTPVLVIMAASATAVPVSLRIRLRPLAPIVLALTAAIVLVRGVAPHHSHSDPHPSQAPQANHIHH
jgi:sulfite exporter TauE/SafE